MKTSYPHSAWACLDAIKAEELDAEERAALLETMITSLKNNPDSLYLAAAVLVDHEYIDLWVNMEFDYVSGNLSVRSTEKEYLCRKD